MVSTPPAMRQNLLQCTKPSFSNQQLSKPQFNNNFNRQGRLKCPSQLINFQNQMLPTEFQQNKEVFGKNKLHGKVFGKPQNAFRPNKLTNVTPVVKQ